MWNAFRKALAASVDLLLPPICLLCGELQPAGHCHQALCRACTIAILPMPVAYCRLCAQPFPDATSKHHCAACLKRPPLFTKVHTAGLYQGSIKSAIQQLKYRNQICLAKPLGLLLGKALIAAEDPFVPDQIVPVPLHLGRLRQRGYNQALEIARPIAAGMGLRCNTTMLQRIRNTPHQQGLSATERRSNLRNAFSLKQGCTARKVLLIDDVMTTGETVHECCRTLMTGDTEEIQVAIVGRV